MPKRRTTTRHVRDVDYEEAFPALPTELLELIYAAKDAAGIEYERVPSPDDWERLGKQGRLRYLAQRDRELPKLIREEERRADRERHAAEKAAAEATVAREAEAAMEAVAREAEPWNFYERNDR